MPRIISKRDKERQGKNITEWDKAIVDAERGIERLKAAIRTCREMKESGEPWPGSVPAIHASTQN
jgi:hypothetical protein